MTRGTIAALWLVLTLCAGCGAKAADPPCRRTSFEGSGFTVCRYRPSEDELRLAEASGGKPIDTFLGLRNALGPDAGRLAFAMNGGMYGTDQRAIGLLVLGGKSERGLNQRSAGGNFYLKPNGVFWVGADGAPHVTETSAYAATPPAAAWATQSGPLLVAKGQFNPQIQPNGASLAVRNGVGVDLSGAAYFVISDEAVSFGRLARYLRDGLKCPDALYLDGSVSSLWAPNLDREDSTAGLGTFVIVLSRPAQR